MQACALGSTCIVTKDNIKDHVLFPAENFVSAFFLCHSSHADISPDHSAEQSWTCMTSVNCLNTSLMWTNVKF